MLQSTQSDKNTPAHIPAFFQRWATWLIIALIVASSFPLLLWEVELIGSWYLLTYYALLTPLLVMVSLSLFQAEEIRKKDKKISSLEASNRGKDEFLTTLSHELRVPMSSVVNAGRLLKLGKASMEQQTYISQLNTAARHALSLTNNLVDQAQKKHTCFQPEVTPFSLDESLKEIERIMLARAKDEGLHLKLNNHFHILRKYPTGDPLRLRQVLLNLLDNAIKCTYKGGVALTITPQQVSSTEIELLFEVSDTGTGISPEQQQKLLRPVSQIDNNIAYKDNRSGLGLSISQKLIHHMGGVLQVNSQPEQGSCFFFQLIFPLTDTQPEIEQTRPFSDSGLWIPTRVLLVDDDEINCLFSSALLKHFGAIVESCGSGADALKLIQRNTYDLVFMDISMPDMDGYETTLRIHQLKSRRELHIVALTAHTSVDERQRCLEVGMDDYLSKPFSISAIEQVLVNITSAKISHHNLMLK